MNSNAEKAYDIGFQAGIDALHTIEDYFYGSSEENVKDSLVGLLVFLMSSCYTSAPTPESAELLISTAQKTALENWERGKNI
mgnify:CR=1 FL=1